MKKLIILLIIVFAFESIYAQENNNKKSLARKNVVQDSAAITMEYIGKKTKLLKSMIIPTLIIGYGLTTLNNSGLYSSNQAQHDIQRAVGNHGAPIDDYLVLSPYVEFGALLLLKVKCKNDMINTLLLIAKSEAIMAAMVFPLKYLTNVKRPDGSDLHSFPSGHTAEAFVAATIVYREYRYISNWYGIGAYALASTVGVYRMINNKHWESDVLVGAGIGMLSANLVYATHLNRWGRKDVCIVPTYDGNYKGFAMSFNF